MLLLRVLKQVTFNSYIRMFCTVCVLYSVYCCTRICLLWWLCSPLCVFKTPVTPKEALGLWEGTVRRCLGGMPAWSHTQCLTSFVQCCYLIGMVSVYFGTESAVLKSCPTNLFLDLPVLNFELSCSQSS